MFPTLYFPLVGAKSVRCAPAAFLDKLLEGNLGAAAAHSNRWADDEAHGDDAPWLLQLHADMQATLGIGDEAEEQYRRAQKLVRSPRQLIRAMSCRNAGWQALFRHRLATSVSCFARVIDETGLDPLQQLDARFGVVCALHELGHPREAREALDVLAELAAQIEANEPGIAEAWREVITTLRYDMAVQRELRADPLLSDHVYWHSDLTDENAGLDASDVAKLHEIAALRVRTPLLRQRIDYLRRLRALMHGERDAMEGISRHLGWVQQVGMQEYGRTTQIEVVLSALVGGAVSLAETMIEPLNRADHVASTGHRQIEYLYCVAKVRQAQGRARESMQCYGRYALVATRCLRADAHAIAPFVNRNARQAAQLDDVGARLPAKYRRAYRYMQENLDRPDLSVRELAVEIGVSERALQTAFKDFLGLSPTELIRRERMERIRAELLESDFSNDHNILGVASKWGVQNRSTLVAGYRKQFSEAPSETLER